LVTDSDGNVFVTGFYSGTVTTSVNGTNTTLPSAIGTDGFIAKLNASDGDFLWVSSFGNDPGYVGTKDDAGYGIALDHSEDVYVTGVAHLNYTWGITNHGQQFDNANISGHKRTDIAIFKLNSTEGTFSWIDIIGGSGRDYGLDIVLDKHYNIFVAGLYNDQIYYSNSVAPNDSVVDFDASPHSSHYLAGDSTQLANRFLMKMSLRSIVHITEEICSGDSYEFNDTILYDTGTYYDTLINVAGYDSIITLNLTVNYPTAGIDTIMACDSYTWIDGNTYNSNNNTATHTLTNVAGCDSVATLDLIINESPTTIDTHIVCHGSTFTWVDGNTYAAGTNTPTYTIPNGSVHGCDSTITLNLIFDSAITGIDTQTACNSYTWIDGNTYTTSTNSIVHTLTATNGCDSVVTLNLTINHSTDSTITYQGVSGDGYAINVNGTVYNENNPTGTEILMNAAGCDSIVTINLLYPVAIEDLNGINEMTIFPNPFSSTVKVHFTDTQAGQLKLTLLDILSREITSKIYTTQSGKNELSLEIPEHVGAGTMILIIERNGKIHTQQLVKE